MGKYSMVIMNVGSPSLTRAEKQIEWIETHSFDIIILTEYSANKASLLFEKFFSSCGYSNYFNLKGKDRGVLIAHKNKIHEHTVHSVGIKLDDRLVHIQINIHSFMFQIIGIYVPPNDKNKNTRKKGFVNKVKDYLCLYDVEKPILLCGDFNTVTREHIPKYTTFREWEYNFFEYLDHINLFDIDIIKNNAQMAYSWFGNAGNKYKYDYCYGSKKMCDLISKITYNCETIQLKLSDHAAIEVLINSNENELDISGGLSYEGF